MEGLRSYEKMRRGPGASVLAGSMLLVIALAVTTSGCSVKKFAVNKLGDALANGSATTYASDDDPELIRSAVPFSLKLIEGLLAESPKHRGLLLAAGSGFTQYAYAFVQQDAEEMEEKDLATAMEMRARTRKLYLRARDYALRGLEVRHAGFTKALREDPQAAVRSATKKDVPMLYWAAVSWGAAISLSKDNPEMVADKPIVEALADRALELDEQFSDGAIHGFLIAYEGARQGAKGDPDERARRHYERAVELTGGQMAGPYVSLAENVCIGKQNRGEFERVLKRALEIDVDAKPEWRLANLVMQRRARWLLGRADQLFAEEKASAEGGKKEQRK